MLCSGNWLYCEKQCLEMLFSAADDYCICWKITKTYILFIWNILITYSKIKFMCHEFIESILILCWLWRALKFTRGLAEINNCFWMIPPLESRQQQQKKKISESVIELSSLWSSNSVPVGCSGSDKSNNANVWKLQTVGRSYHESVYAVKLILLFFLTLY